ncbi:succinyl-diaminopimelate desuccinylase [Aquabacter sp. CN5-332]|uniref:succinyl-diaminopimelate desuccinylase n=1 Tax=Aquabacter sp. CN5-332 TaxID=3156608 RepID=UPI0032B56E22
MTIAPDALPTFPDPREPVALAQALIREPSVTPHAHGAVDLVAHVLEGAGYQVERLVFDTGGPAIPNLYARIGTSHPNLCFAGHLDVVPPGDVALWNYGPFAGEIADGVLYGRGAVDMKGGLAAALAAAIRHGAPRKGSISFLITGDEEGLNVDGTVKVVEWLKARGEQVDHCVLGEPTNPQALGDAIKIGRRGSLSGLLTVNGKQGHVAYPELADNPIPLLLNLLGALTTAPLDQGSEFFQPSNLEVVSIDVGNSASNVIPAQARALFNVRFNDRFTLAGLKAEITSRLDGAGVPYTLAFRNDASESFLTAPGPFVDLVRAAVAEETGRQPETSTSGGTSDARFIKDICPVVEFGLVSRTLHAVNEATPISDIEDLARIYGRIIALYFERFA